MTAELELAAFIDKFAPPLQERIRECRAKLSSRFPGAFQLVYDNYNFLVIGFSSSPRPSDSVLSLAAHRKGINLCFLQRAGELPDPTRLLRGTGTVTRNVPLESAASLDRPDIARLIRFAAETAPVPLSDARGGQLMIRSVSAKQRPRQ
jgi:hypothetical protein